MRLNIHFDDQARTLYADLSLSEESETISSLSLTGKLEEAGYKNLTLPPQTISELLAHAQQGKECTIALKTLVDATVSVTIASDARQAYLTLTAADGGQPFTLDMISHAIAQAGVSDSLVDQETVNQCYQRQSVNNICIAQATLPIQGKDAVYLPLVETETIVPPDMDEHGVADMMNTHHFSLVDAGTSLMKRVPATEGTAGVDVTCQDMQPVSGNDPGFATNLTGVEISPEDPNLLVAAVKGHPVIVKNGINIDATLHVDTVDVTTGNITFDGSLEVKGDVADGMVIDVTGDVFIRGGVERAAIHAGHSIKVVGGIFGVEEVERPEEEIIEYTMKAGSDIEAKFVHLATLMAEHNIIVKDYISHSYVKAGNQLLVGQKVGKGMVFGGHSQALHQVVLKQLGNETYVATHVTAGKLSELTRVYHNLEKELATRSQEAAQLETILQQIQKSDPVVLGTKPLEKSEKIRHTIVAINGKRARTQELLRSMEPELALQKKAAIEVTKRIYPNAVMTINGTTKHFSEQTGGTTWVQWGDHLVEQGKKGREP